MKTKAERRICDLRTPWWVGQLGPFFSFSFFTEMIEVYLMEGLTNPFWKKNLLKIEKVWTDKKVK